MTEENRIPALCSQCGRAQAVMTIGGAPICIGCEFTFQQSRYMQFQMQAAMLNHAAQELTQFTGMPAAQIATPPAPVPHFRYNNQVVNITDSHVDSINVAQEIGHAQTTIQTLAGKADFESAAGFTALIAAVADAELDDTSKRDLLQQCVELAKAAASPSQERKPGMIKALFSSVKSGAEGVASIAGAWQALEPLLRGTFQI